MGAKSGNPEWKDFPDLSTPVDAAALENIEEAIDESYKMENMTEATNAKVMTAAERAKLNGLPTGGSFGALAFKDRISALDIEAGGNPSQNTFYRGDGQWAVPQGGGGGGTVAQDFQAVNVVTGSEGRPSATNVMWIGGLVRPVNMQNGDVWLAAGPILPTAPVIVTTTFQSPAVGVAMTFSPVYTGTTPMTWAIVSGALPAGLSLNTSSGTISGTPTTAGAFSFTLQATNSVGSDSKVYSGTVSATVVAPTIITTSLPVMTQGVGMSQQLAASGTAPFSWSVVGGILPSGLSLNSSTGAITGAPAAAGAYSFTVQASNSGGSDTQVYSGSVTSNVVPPTITTNSLNAMTQGVTFSQTLGVTGSTPMTWGVYSGSLPNGLSINTSTGVISGTPTTPGSYSFTIRASNAIGTDDKLYTVTVGAAAATAPVITTTSLGTVRQSIPYSITLAATGTAPITYSLVAGSLPAGLTLNGSTGAITGTPSALGAYSFTIRATNSAGYDDQTFTGSVTSSVVTHRIFAADHPGTFSTMTDGDVNSWIAHEFYATADLSSTHKVYGVRLWIPAGSSAIGQAWRAQALVSPTLIPAANNAYNPAFSNGTLVVSSVNLVAGWNELVFGTELAGPVNMGAVIVQVRIGDGTTYCYSSNAPARGAAVQSPTLPSFYLSEGGDKSLSEITARAFYNGTSQYNVWSYGIDLVLKEN